MEQNRAGQGKVLFAGRLLLLALTSLSKGSSQRTSTNPSMLHKSTREGKLVIHKQLWTKPEAQDRVREMRGRKKLE